MDLLEPLPHAAASLQQINEKKPVEERFLAGADWPRPKSLVHEVITHCGNRHCPVNAHPESYRSKTEAEDSLPMNTRIHIRCVESPLWRRSQRKARGPGPLQ